VSKIVAVYKIVGRREGDITSAYANTDKANDVLGWKAQSTLEEATVLGNGNRK
jgi:UDP-glucose 4-epimerase